MGEIENILGYNCYPDGGLEVLYLWQDTRPEDKPQDFILTGSLPS